MAVLAVVVTYNRCKLLRRCLSSLEAQTAPCDILVVDNASTDETGYWLAEYQESHPKLRIRSMKVNTGGAGGFCQGIREGALAGYSHLWLMDDDCFPAADALEKLLQADQLLGGAGHYGYLSSAVLWTDGHECRMNRQKIRKSYYEHVELLKDGLIQVEQSTFVSLLVPISTVEKVGLPIKEFFIWGDDIEYTRRITVRHGLPSYLAGRSQVTHAMLTNDGSSIAVDKPERISRYNYAFRNENYLYRQEGLRGFAYYTAKCLLNSVRILRKAPDRRLKRLGVIFRQYFLGLFFQPKIEYLPKQEMGETK